MEYITKIQEKNYEVIFPCAVLFVCFIFMRIITISLQITHIELPFRIMIGLAISFGLIVPLAVIIAGFQDTSMLTAFLLPFAIFGIVTPVLDSALLGYSLTTNPAIIQFYLLGGAGFGIVGIGATRIMASRPYAAFIMLVGIVVILLNAPNYVRVILFILTGDTAYIAGFLDLPG